MTIRVVYKKTAKIFPDPITFLYKKIRPNNIVQNTFHIYLKDRCLFKNLNEDEFDIIWGRLYHSYWDDITYEEVSDIITSDIAGDDSY